VSKKFGEWYQKTNKTEDTNKLTLLAVKIIAILHNTRLATFIMLLETFSNGLFRNRSQNQQLPHVLGLPPHGRNPRTRDSGSAISSCGAFADSIQKLYEHCQQCCEGWRLF
jgi:hypothetical protein